MRYHAAMRLGICAGVEQAPILADAGCDFVELSVAADLAPERDDAHWDAHRRAILAMPLPVEAFNSFVRSLRIVGPEPDTDALRAYVDTALARAAQVGGRIVVFGSAGARNVPDGFPPERALSQIADFLEMCADAAERTGVRVAVEPLCRAESNILNTVGDGARMVRRVGRAGVRNLADTYHMEREDDPLDQIVAHADTLAHVHTADTGREAPATGSYDHVALFRALRRAGYDARVSVECRWRDMAAQAPAAIAHLRRAFAEASTP